MKTMNTEQIGLPETTHAESSFGAETSRQRSWKGLTVMFPDANGLAVDSDYNPINGRLRVRAQINGTIFTHKKREGLANATLIQICRNK